MEKQKKWFVAAKKADFNKLSKKYGISPITARFIFVTDQDLADAVAFCVYPAEYFKNAAGDADSLNTDGTKFKKLTDGKNMKTEFGGYIRLQYTRTEWNAEWMKNIGFTTKLNLFSNYLENPQNVDVDWETLITWKIYKFFNISFFKIFIHFHIISFFTFIIW